MIEVRGHRAAELGFGTVLMAGPRPDGSGVLAIEINWALAVKSSGKRSRLPRQQGHGWLTITRNNAGQEPASPPTF